MSGPLGITLEAGRIAQGKPKEYAVRFAFGAAITVGTGLIAHAFGPLVGGLFLAFPAILPASVTLLQHHEDHKAASRMRWGRLPAGSGCWPSPW